MEYWKSQLDSRAQIAYDEVLREYKNGNRAIIVKNTDNESLDKIHSAITYDHPELYSFPSRYTVSQRPSFTATEYMFTLYDVYPKSAQGNIDASMEKSIQEIKDRIGRETDECKILMLMTDWFMENVTYEIDNTYNQNSASALHFKRAQCSGVSRAVKLVLDRIGIECILVEGALTDEGRSEPHAWNMVKYNDKWYHVDVTNMLYEVEYEERLYSYLLKSDEFLDKNYTWDRSKFPKCKSNKFDYVCWTEEGAEEHIVFNMLYEVSVALRRAYKNRETKLVMYVDLEDETKDRYESNQDIMNYIQRWFDQNAQQISYSINARDIRFEILIEY